MCNGESTEMGLGLGSLRIERKDWAFALLFLVLAFVLRFPSFLQSVLDWDEGVYLLMGRSIVDGNLPYIEIADHKPPGIHLLYALAQIMLGESVLSARIFAGLAVAITGFLLYRLGKIVGGDRKVGLLAGIFYVALSLNSEGLAANTEVFYLAFVTLAFFLFFAAYPAKPLSHIDPRLLFVGLVFGIAIQINYLAIFDLASVFIILGVDLYSRRQEGSTRVFLARIFKSYALLSIGSSFIFLVVVLYFALNGQLQGYLDAAFLTNLAYGSLAGLSWSKLKPVLRQQFANYALVWISIFLTPLYLKIPRDSRREEDKPIIALLIWSVMALLGTLATRRFYLHYFLHLLPPACLLSAYLIVRVVYSNPGPSPPKWRALTLGLIVLAPLFQNIYPTLEMGAEVVFYRHVKGLKHWGDEESAVADYLHERVRSQDYIYVVDGPPTLYYMVRAKTPTRYPFPPHLINEDDFKIPGVNPIQELAAIMEKKPVYVVKQYQEDSPFYTELKWYLDRYYVFESSVNGVKLYRLKSDLK
jgi:4-amino-4-deoxy-L-arabinose transferase-like glycosyltransferase